MAQVPLVLADAADVIDPAIQKMWVNRAPVEVENFTKLCNVETGVTDYNLKESDISDLSLAGRITENASIVGESPVQGFDQTFTQTEYGLLAAVTKRMWEFGIKKRKLENFVDELKRACVRKRETLVANRFNNAQASSYTENDTAGNYTVTTTNANGANLASNAQTREDSGTNNNNIIYDGTTYNLLAGYSLLKALERTAALVLSPKGNQLSISPTRLIVRKGHGAKHRLKEVIGAIKANKLPETFSNDGSGVSGDFEIVEIPYITSSTRVSAVDPAWVDDRHGLQYKESQAIKMEGPNVVFKTGEIQYKATTQFALGVKDYRGTFDSTGLSV